MPLSARGLTTGRRCRPMSKRCCRSSASSGRPDRPALARPAPAAYRYPRQVLRPKEKAMTEGTQLIRGLEGVVAAETRLCDLDGKNGRLAYCGLDIDDLARRATYEEVAYLLWHGELPTRPQLDQFSAELIAARPVPPELIQAFGLMPRRTDPMRSLQAAVAMLGMHDADATDNSRAANRRKAARLTSQIPTAVSAYH